MNGGGFCGSSVSVELCSALEIVPREAEIFLAAIPAVVAFAANKSTHENRSADSPHGVFACGAFSYPVLFIGDFVVRHGVPLLSNAFNYSGF
jgi:hypothetical protein